MPRWLVFIMGCAVAAAPPPLLFLGDWFNPCPKLWAVRGGFFLAGGGVFFMGFEVGPNPTFYMASLKPRTRLPVFPREWSRARGDARPTRSGSAHSALSAHPVLCR